MKTPHMKSLAVLTAAVCMVMTAAPALGAYGGGGSSSISKSMFKSIQTATQAANQDSTTPDSAVADENVPVTKNDSTTKGQIFIDSNSNGMKDGSEVQLASTVVKISLNGGALIDTTVTKSDGSYSFEGLAPGRYTITIVVPSGTFDDTISSSSGIVASILDFIVPAVHAQSSATEYTFEIEVMDDGTVVQIDSVVGVTPTGVNANTSSVVTATVEESTDDDTTHSSAQEQAENTVEEQVPFEPTLPAPRSSIEEILATIDGQLYEQRILAGLAGINSHGSAGAAEIILPDHLPNTGASF